jgi:hypothetical protein
MNKVNRAYLVIAICKKSEMICGCGIFSEEYPTTTTDIHLFCPLSQPGNDYEDARNNLLKTLTNGYYDWENKIYNKYGWAL